MKVTPEILMAFADGELDDVTAERVARQVAQDPELSRQLEAHRALKSRLDAHFLPLESAPMPEAWTQMISAAAKEDAKVVPLAPRAAARTAMRPPARWATGLAIAASLALGLVLGAQLRQASPVTVKGDAMVASAGLARALDTQLASNQAGAPIRMLASYRAASGTYCRVFSGRSLSGIACRQDEAWQIERLLKGNGAKAAEYRQAGSADGELMAAAQDMAAGDPLDEAQEKAARASGWR